MSKAAPAFIPRRSFVKHKRLSIDSAAFFASADSAAPPFSRTFLTIKANLSAETITWLHFWFDLESRNCAASSPHEPSDMRDFRLRVSFRISLRSLQTPVAV
jgi:hypothetical protein